MRVLVFWVSSQVWNKPHRVIDFVYGDNLLICAVGEEFLMVDCLMVSWTNQMHVVTRRATHQRHVWDDVWMVSWLLVGAWCWISCKLTLYIAFEINKPSGIDLLAVLKSSAGGELWKYSMQSIFLCKSLWKDTREVPYKRVSHLQVMILSASRDEQYAPATWRMTTTLRARTRLGSSIHPSPNQRSSLDDKDIYANKPMYSNNSG